MTDKFKHVMIDIEALGKNNKAPVVAIGAVFFDPVKNTLGPRFYEKITLESAMQMGGLPDASTIIYWLRQSSEARSEIIDATQHISLALRMFQVFLIEHSVSLNSLRVWGNGPTYDITILENAFRMCGFEVPWEFYRVRDVRTAVEFGRWDDFDPKRTLPFDGTPHNAVDDATHQARYVSAIVSRLVTAKDEESVL